MEIEPKIKQAFKALSLEKEVIPVSMKEIAEMAELSLEDVTEHYAGIDAISGDVWMDYLRDTMAALDASEEFPEYSTREKLLAFYYTFIEVIRPERKFILLYEDDLGIWNYKPAFLVLVKGAFLEYVDALVMEGKETDEIEDRYMIGGEYTGWHWPQFLYLLNFWVNDKSPEFAKTDQAIEKSVNLGFDLMGRNVLDSAADFLKFLVSRK